MAKTWGPEIWERKISSQDPVGVILGTGFSKKTLVRNTNRTMDILTKTILPLLPKGATILDVGVGPSARFSIELARLGFTMTGLDGSETTLNFARQAVAQEGARLKVEFIKADFANFEFPQPADGIICVETFFHIPGHLTLSAFSCFNRALKPSGFALVQFAVQNEMTVGFLTYNLFYRCCYLVLKPIFHLLGRKSFYVTVNRTTDDEIQDIAKRSGFSIISNSKNYYLFQKVSAV